MDADYVRQDQLVRDLISQICERHELLTEDRLADLVGYSVVHICRVFYASEGVTLGDYMRRIRLERVAGMLSSSNQPIADIALAAHYSSGAALTRAFRAEFEVPPSEFRALNQGEEHLMPSYIYETDPARARAPMVVGHFIDNDLIVTRCYDQLALVGRVLPHAPGDIPVWSPVEEALRRWRKLHAPYGGY